MSWRPRGPAPKWQGRPRGPAWHPAPKWQAGHQRPPGQRPPGPRPPGPRPAGPRARAAPHQSVRSSFLRPRFLGAKAGGRPAPRPSAASKMRMKLRPSALGTGTSSLEEPKGNGKGAETVVAIEWVPEEDEDALAGEEDAVPHQEEEADWGCEAEPSSEEEKPEEVAAPDEDLVEKDKDESMEEPPDDEDDEDAELEARAAALRQAEPPDDEDVEDAELEARAAALRQVEYENGHESDANEEGGLRDAPKDLQKEGAETGVPPAAAMPDAAARAPSRCLGVLKMHNPKRDFGFISPLLSIPKGVPLPRGSDGLWFFGAPKLQGKGPLVGREVYFDVSAGKEGQSKTQAIDIVLVEEEAEFRRSEVLQEGAKELVQQEPVRVHVKQELFEAQSEHATATAHVADKEPTRRMVFDPHDRTSEHATATKHVADRELTRISAKKEVGEVEEQHSTGHQHGTGAEHAASSSVKKELIETKPVAGMEVPMSDVADKGPTRGPLHYRERFSFKAVKGETWSSDVGFTRVKIEYQEPAKVMADKAMDSAQKEPRASKLEQREPFETFAQNGEPRMNSSFADSSAAYKSAEAVRTSPGAFAASQHAAKVPEQQLGEMQRLRSLVEAGPYYKCFPCKAAIKGNCMAGDSCPDAHTLQEVRPLPDTKLVRKIAKRSTMEIMTAGAPLPMPLGMMWGMPQMGMGMPPMGMGMPPFGIPPYVESRSKKRKRKSRYSD